MGLVWMIIFTALPEAYAVAYIVHSFKRKKIRAAIGMLALSLLALFMCVVIALVD